MKILNQIGDKINELPIALSKQIKLRAIASIGLLILSIALHIAFRNVYLVIPIMLLWAYLFGACIVMYLDCTRNGYVEVTGTCVLIEVSLIDSFHKKSNKRTVKKIFIETDEEDEDEKRILIVSPRVQTEAESIRENSRIRLYMSTKSSLTETESGFYVSEYYSLHCLDNRDSVPKDPDLRNPG